VKKEVQENADLQILQICIFVQENADPQIRGLCGSADPRVRVRVRVRFTWKCGSADPHILAVCEKEHNH